MAVNFAKLPEQEAMRGPQGACHDSTPRLRGLASALNADHRGKQYATVQEHSS